MIVMESVDLKEMDSVYFLGIGGIGMSALARYFKVNGYAVAGYDRTRTPLTLALEEEGIMVNYTDQVAEIPFQYRNPATTLLVYTPAIPADNLQLGWFVGHAFVPHKRAEVLGMLSRAGKALCVAGTHGKTTTTTILTYILQSSHVGCSAFLGGIARNYNSNLVLNSSSEYIVVEADEYDRSFLHLEPWIAAITAMDNDHMDIYGTRESMLEAFAQFASQRRDGGALFLKSGLELQGEAASRAKVDGWYGVENDADYCAKNLRIVDSKYEFDYVSPEVTIEGVRLGIPGRMNVENAVIAITIALRCGVTPDEIRECLPDFKGVVRRFNIHVDSENGIYVDDYAHHPEEIKATLGVAREMWSDKKLTVIFQPHLFTRTRDLYVEFAQALSLADKVILTEIYPAREEPIEGVTSEIIMERLTTEKVLVKRDELLDYLAKDFDGGVLLTVGAGNIDQLIPHITEWMKHRK